MNKEIINYSLGLSHLTIKRGFCGLPKKTTLKYIINVRRLK